jgi:fructose-bisphosphate aldolase/2-amino-3,7-dideoxy-D-threo-hept-6-ulosonate synthase
MIGKKIRLNHIFNFRSNRTFIVPLDHGFTQGQIPSLSNMRDLIIKINEGGANAIIIHKGMVNSVYKNYEKNIGLIIHLSGSTSMSSHPDYKVLVTSVEEAITLGADAVSIQINFGVPYESKMIQDAGNISRDCNRWGMPLLIMAYPRGNNHDPYNPQLIGHCVRVAEELGADIIKINYPREKRYFQEIVTNCSVPILIAGGEKTNDGQLTTMVKDAISVGGGGVCIGRNVFERENPSEFVSYLCTIIHGT